MEQSFQAFGTFISLLKSESFSSFNSQQEIQLIFRCAREIELLFESNDTDIRAKLVEKLKDTAISVEELQVACDGVLKKALTTVGLSDKVLWFCIQEYVDHCSENRCVSVISETVLQSEAFKEVVHILSVHKAMKDECSIKFQASLLCKAFADEDESFSRLTGRILRWLRDPKYSLNPAVALVTMDSNSKDSSIFQALLTGLCTILQEREQAAVNLCESFIKFPSSATSVLEKSPLLLNSVFDFLSISVNWMHATQDLRWVSTESGPCIAVDLARIASLLQCIIGGSNFLANEVKMYLRKNVNSPGCTIWDDIFILVIS